MSRIFICALCAVFALHAQEAESAFESTLESSPNPESRFESSPNPESELESSAQDSNIRVTNTQELPPELAENNPYLQTDEQNESTSLLDNVYGHVGFFGKTNMLGKNNDSYGVFSGSLGLTYTLFDIELGLGIYGMTHMLEYPNNNAKQYVASKFLTNNAYVKYSMEDFFNISAGRYRAHRDWLRNFVQGLGVDVNYNWIKVWAEWSDEQAIVSREFLSDFEIFKRNYSRQFLISAGAGLNFFGLDLSPYYYFLNTYFWAAGVKVGLDIDINKAWNSETTIHYAFLHAKQNISHTDSLLSSNINANDESSILWVEQAFSFEKGQHSTTFGVGYVKVWDAYFELANMGSISRFATNSYHGYNGIEPGEIYNGSNSSNMFDANTSTIYGFAGYQMDFFSILLLGRYSKSANVRQDLYSIGAKWKIIEGFYVGGMAAFMKENSTNMSFAKGYIEFAI